MAGFSKRIVVSIALGAAALWTACSASAAPARAFAGQYNGSQMEMATVLELGADGRFQYELSYGALDEQAQGNWVADADGVRLTSDAVAVPRFALMEQGALARRLHIDLDVPHGMSRQYFLALITMADGRTTEEQLSEDGLDLELAPDDRPISVAMLLTVYDIKGESVALSVGSGAKLHFRFDPNDLGKVAFANQLLRNENGALVLERYDRVIRYRRSGR